MTNVDEDLFFREATLRLCSSLDIQVALNRCYEYIRAFIPVMQAHLHILDFEQNVLRLVALVGAVLPEGEEHILHLPEKGRREGAAFWKTGEVIRIVNQPDPIKVNPEILRRLGFRENVSYMSMVLELEGSRIGNLGLMADGVNQYTDEHARLLRLLREPMSIAMSNALEHQEVIRFKQMLADDNKYLLDELRSVSGDEIIGADFGLNMVMRMVEQVAPLDSPVLLLGETGTGKELIANAIHSSSPRKDGPFIKVNCGAIPETLLDSELFGHEKGAFTGAISRKRGRFERADKGTIFLDEIGELPAQAQVRLLHVLQRKEIERVGGTSSIPVDIRIISATHRNLQEMVGSGQFREDLWFRINVFPIMIPPLRQRRGDIPSLVHHFIHRKSMELKLKERPRLAPDAMDTLTAYDWPGNVRELENTIERALIQHRTGGPLSFEALLPLAAPDKVVQSQSSQNEPLVPLDEMNARHIRRALEKAGGKIYGPGGAAQILNINPSTLRKRMNKLGISYGRKSWRL
ncbi:MAG: sigma 54-interacting transcriptional regulator [Deltaproteobacteria bacterium]|uniref:ATPase AAA n=2 Tax=Desulforhabdus amnigena TaxID=40218 RepID=A0A9W6CV36_9BACT|nr:sigma 54-interacting transcriptional regulator [Deltaproteobacteria bacterium]GLI33059.1 ATPase AAA [Desulforhabdus amnigena]